MTASKACNKVPITMKFIISFKAQKLRDLEEQCRRNGLAMTVQRRVVLDALAERTDHPSADQLYDAVRGRLRGISRTTVYRVLETLVGIGVVLKISNPESKARYDANAERHHHIHCIHCQKIQDVHNPAICLSQMPAETEAGFTVLDYSINFSGVCPDCMPMTLTAKGGHNEKMEMRCL